MLEADFKYIIDTFFALFSMVLIIFMVPGFAMLEAGLVRTKNVTAVLTINMIIYAVASIMFLLIGLYNCIWFLGRYFYECMGCISFQMAFVGKSVNIMSGGMSERVRIIPVAVFAVMMGGFIYPSVVNITWGADILAGTFLDIDMYDLAGSTVIHSTGGWALLAGLIIMGARKGRYVKGKVRAIPASNIPLVFLGGFLLWIGWFGFNGGSVGSISSVEMQML